MPNHSNQVDQPPTLATDSQRGDPRAPSESPNHGHTTFHITYDDTGATVEVVAPNGWHISKVIEEGYRLLGETPRPGDRVEADGVDLAPYLGLHVKLFMEQGIAPAAHFNIVSNTGGAVEPGVDTPQPRSINE